MERKVYLLPEDLVARIKSFQADHNISSEVEAARHLLDSALQGRDTIESILLRLKEQFSERRNLRELAGSILVTHVLVTDLNMSDEMVTFKIRTGQCGMIDRIGNVSIGEYPASTQGHA